MECRRCAACDRAFRPRAQVPHQRYCALAACQRERRRRWQQSKLHGDADYRANQRQAQRAWADSHGARRSARLAKMDAPTPINPIPSGTYRLLAATAGDLAKKDAWTVKITVISEDYAPGGKADAILQREDVIGAAEPGC